MCMQVEQKIKALGIDLPPESPPGAMYVPVKQLGIALFVPGQVPFVNGKLAVSCQIGTDRSLA